MEGNERWREEQKGTVNLHWWHEGEAQKTADISRELQQPQHRVLYVAHAKEVPVPIKVMPTEQRIQRRGVDTCTYSLLICVSSQWSCTLIFTVKIVYYCKGNLELNNSLWDLFWHVLLLWCVLMLLENDTLCELVYGLRILKEISGSQNTFFKQSKVKNRW